MWEIREGYDRDDYGRNYGMRSSDAYECGFEDGYEKAMKEMGHFEYGHRMRRY